MVDSDKYFALPYIQYFNLIKKAYENKEVAIDDIYCDPSNIYLEKMQVGSETSIAKILTNENGLLDINKISNCGMHQLPIVTNYINAVLCLIEIDSQNYNPDSIGDIYLDDIDEDNKPEKFDAYIRNSKTLHYHVSYDTLDSLIHGQTSSFSIPLQNNNCGIFIEDSYYKKIQQDKTIVEDIHYYNNGKFPFPLNDIQKVVLTLFSNTNNTTATFKVCSMETKPSDIRDNSCIWDIIINIDELLDIQLT